MTIRVAGVDVTLDEARLREAAAVGTRVMLRRIGPRVLSTARTNIGRAQYRRAPVTPDRYLKRPRGSLAASGRITYAEGHDGPELEVTFGDASAPYARFHHEGTVPHKIVPRHEGGRLFFWWARYSRFESRGKEGVNHPGTLGNPYLTDAGDEALTRDPSVHVLGTIVRHVRSG